ncbi:GNAT family N-acetyltransferase [Trinickia diaoshuihuensis]|jgi:ribosomal protein S18 acetylase RimI-like enzyme|uniref:GNAT family N-acetyltransferase n=1 Tax=Trinickia diaoshuihuensis TaxID=2292265 RepID=UPI000E2390A6|nr:GNAT family N-acetyltransferase [Trinickia diaoshuihuensis]
MHAIRAMTIEDYDAVIELMKRTPGVTFRDADSREATSRYLERNPGLSFVATVEGEIVGCLMSGHDGRRGYLQHLVVQPAHRRKGIANALVGTCLDALARHGIVKSHLDVLKSNELAHAYWRSQGWTLRTDIDRYSFIRGTSENA